MKTVRQNTILEIIAKNEVETQEDLVSLLNQSGFNVTQATISRDIKELKLIKVLSDKGVYKYAPGDMKKQSDGLDVYIRMFRDTVRSIDQAANIIVVKTIAGSANVAAETIDNLGLSDIVGTIAGDNTIFVAVREERLGKDILKRFRQMMK